MYPEHIETKRLRGERITEADLPRLREMNRNLAVMRTLGGVRDEAGTRSLLDCLIDDWQAEGFGLWWLYDRAKGQSAGYAGLRRTRVEGVDVVEVDYALLPQFWGKGYATEIAALCVDLAQSELHLPDVVCFTQPTNLASQRVMQKTGFAYEKDIMYAGTAHMLHRIRFVA